MGKRIPQIQSSRCDTVLPILTTGSYPIAEFSSLLWHLFSRLLFSWWSCTDFPQSSSSWSVVLFCSGQATCRNTLVQQRPAEGLSLVPGTALGTGCSRRWQGMSFTLLPPPALCSPTSHSVSHCNSQPVQWISARRNKMSQAPDSNQQQCSVS